MKIDISQHAEFGPMVKAQLTKTTQKALFATAQRLVTVVVTEIIPNEEHPPVDRGLYRAGWRIKKGPSSVTIFNATPAAGHIEWGVRASHVKPGRAMIASLAAWVKRKGLGASLSIKTHKVRKASGKEATNIAWAIAKSMQKKGIFNRGVTSGLSILGKAVLRFDRIFREEFKRALAQESR